MLLPLTILSLLSIAVVDPLLAESREIRNSIDSRVVQVELPLEDLLVSYVESPSGMLVQVSAGKASVSGTKFYVGDGEIALELKVEHPRGILFQGREDWIGHGSRFEKYSVIEVLPGYKQNSQLVPGDVYVKVRGMNWKLPEAADEAK
ncbi:MAG TPA: hypothetical protein VGN57_06975 [Pirellulaceae bacterium]|jgi:hypothetical protein|nr:hypothetical protein [Pirellulaceae bacterium]